MFLFSYTQECHQVKTSNLQYQEHKHDFVFTHAMEKISLKIFSKDSYHGFPPSFFA